MTDAVRCSTSGSADPECGPHSRTTSVQPGDRHPPRHVLRRGVGTEPRAPALADDWRWPVVAGWSQCEKSPWKRRVIVLGWLVDVRVARDAA